MGFPVGPFINLSKLHILSSIQTKLSMEHPVLLLIPLLGSLAPLIETLPSSLSLSRPQLTPPHLVAFQMCLISNPSFMLPGCTAVLSQHTASQAHHNSLWSIPMKLCDQDPVSALPSSLFSGQRTSPGACEDLQKCEWVAGIPCLH